MLWRLLQIAIMPFAPHVTPVKAGCFAGYMPDICGSDIIIFDPDIPMASKRRWLLRQIIPEFADFAHEAR